MPHIPDDSAYITSPPLAPVLPHIITTSTGHKLLTRDALPIARAVLLAEIKALKDIPGGAKKTAYMLERACFHLTRVRIEQEPNPKPTTHIRGAAVSPPDPTSPPPDRT